MQKEKQLKNNTIIQLKFTKALLKINNFLIVRIHDNIKHIPDFVMRPTVPIVSKLDQFLSEIHQILKKICSLCFYRVKLNGKVLIPEEFCRAPRFK